MTKPAPKQDDHKADNPEQYRRFIELAKELGAEEGEDVDALVRRLAAHGPQPRPEPEQVRTRTRRKRKPS